MLGRSTSYTARGLTRPRPGVFSARRPRSLLARAFARNSPLKHMDWLLVVVVLGLSAIGTLLVWSATQPSLLAAGQDHPGGHAVRQVQVAAPAVAVAVHVGDEVQAPAVADHLVDSADPE